MLYIYLSLASSKIPVTRYVVAKLRSTFAIQTHYMQACLSPITLVYDLDKHHLKADASRKLVIANHYSTSAQFILLIPTKRRWGKVLYSLLSTQFSCLVRSVIS